MKIVRIVTTNEGGAGLCVQRLHRAIIGLDAEDKVFIANGSINDESTVRVAEDFNFFNKCYLLKQLKKVLLKINFCSRLVYYRYRLSKIQKEKYVFGTLPFSMYKGLRKQVDQERADIINLHWISNFVDFPSFFKDVKTPIVWSLHDENPVRGCLHYDTDYAKIRAFDKKVQKFKKDALKNVQNMHVVVQSQYMKSLCEKSSLLNRFPITIIPNGVNTDDFVMLEKNVSRSKLGIPEYAKVYMFSSVVLNDSRKGLAKLINVLERMDDDNIVLLCVGSYTVKPVSKKIDIRCYGYVSDYTFYSTLYSAASFFVLSSTYESFAKTTLEAMACGTPVVAYPCSGTHDCIRNFNGVICEGFSEQALYDGIVVASKQKYNSTDIRKYVVENFTFELMAIRYLTLYKTILNPNETFNNNH